MRLGLCQLTSIADRNAYWGVERNRQRELVWVRSSGKREPIVRGHRVHHDKARGITYGVDQDDRPVMTRELDWVPVATNTPTDNAQELTAWWDDDGIRGVKLSMRADPDCVIGPQTGPRSAAIKFDVDERITRIVFTNADTAWGPTLRAIMITTNRQGAVVLGPPARAEAEASEAGAATIGHKETTDQTIDVRDGALCGLFGSVDPDSKRVVSLGFQLRGAQVQQDVIDHLNDNRLYYSQAIWANVDELALTRILASYTYDSARSKPGEGGRNGAVPLGAQLDPIPVAMTGNYLGFRWHFPTEEERKQWMADEGLVEGGRWRQSKVSLATDGVFAEAVLGRSNGAEKLDITRFWDWQTSPIPILPSEIAPVDTGSRARDVAPETGQLAPTAAAIRALPTLPEPTGAAAALQAIAASNLFRDMSGLDATSALLQKGLELAAQSEGKSAEQATKAMQQATEHMQKMSQIAVQAAKDVAPLVLGPAGATAGALANPSLLGALTNLASDGKTPDKPPGPRN